MNTYEEMANKILAAHPYRCPEACGGLIIDRIDARASEAFILFTTGEYTKVVPLIGYDDEAELFWSRLSETMGYYLSRVFIRLGWITNADLLALEAKRLEEEEAANRRREIAEYHRLHKIYGQTREGEEYEI